MEPSACRTNRSAQPLPLPASQAPLPAHPFWLYQHGTDAWMLLHNASATGALVCWSAELKAVSFCVSARGNHYRQRVFSAWLSEPSGVYRFFTTYKNVSYVEPNWCASHSLGGCADNQRSRVKNKTTTAIELDCLFAGYQYRSAPFACRTICGRSGCACASRGAQCPSCQRCRRPPRR